MPQLNVNTLVLKKQHGSDGVGVVNSVDEFGVYVAESMPDMDATEAKVEGDSQDWPDEDGLDVFDAERQILKEFEVEIPCLCYGETTAECRASFRSMLNYLTGRPYVNRNGTLRNPKGTLMMVFQPWVGYGRRDVRYKSVSDKDFWRDSNGNTIYTFTLKMEVCDPHSVVVMENSDLVVNNSTDTDGRNQDVVYYGSSHDSPVELDTDQNEMTMSGATVMVSVTTTAAAMRKSHWVALSLDSHYHVSDIADGNGDSLMAYAQTITSDGCSITYIRSYQYIADTTIFTLTRE